MLPAQRTAQERIMKRIRIPNYKKVYAQYFMDYQFMQFIDRFHYTVMDYQNSKKGGCTKKINYTFDNKKFVLYEDRTKNRIDISIRRKNDTESAPSCLHIIINSSATSGIAYVQNISYYKDRCKIGLNYQSGGSILLKLCIQYLKENQIKYGAKRITLNDNSTFICNSNQERIEFSLMHTLLFGDTWYGKYGFRPYEPYKNIPDDTLNDFYKKNKLIVEKTLVRDTNLFEYIRRVVRKKVNGSKEQDELLLETERMWMEKYYENFKDYTIGRFFKTYLNDFQETCKHFSEFYIEYAHDCGIYNFYGESFYLDI
jgi:hypothetical protein